MELLVLVVGLVLLAVLALRFGHDSREGLPGNETFVALDTGRPAPAPVIEPTATRATTIKDGVRAVSPT